MNTRNLKGSKQESARELGHRHSSRTLLSRGDVNNENGWGWRVFPFVDILARRTAYLSFGSSRSRKTMLGYKSFEMQKTDSSAQPLAGFRATVQRYNAAKGSGVLRARELLSTITAGLLNDCDGYSQIERTHHRACAFSSRLPNYQGSIDLLS